jgi:hypothetical protein
VNEFHKNHSIYKKAFIHFSSSKAISIEVVISSPHSSFPNINDRKKPIPHQSIDTMNPIHEKQNARAMRNWRYKNVHEYSSLKDEARNQARFEERELCPKENGVAC